MITKRIIFLAVSFLFALNVTNAQNDSKMNLNDLNGNWKLSVMNGKKIDKDKEASLYVDIKESRIGGRAFCNSYFATIDSITDNYIRFSNSGSTRMACPDLNLEYEYLQSLDKVRGYKFANDTFSLKDEKGKELFQFIRFEYKDGKFNTKTDSASLDNNAVAQNSGEKCNSCWFSRMIDKIKGWFK